MPNDPKSPNHDDMRFALRELSPEERAKRAAERAAKAAKATSNPTPTNPDDMRFDVRMSTPEEQAESSKKPPEPSKVTPSKGDGASRPPCIMGTGKTIPFSPTGSKPPPQNTPSSSKDSPMPIPRKLIAVVLFAWAAAFIYPAWDVENVGSYSSANGQYPSSRSFYWRPPNTPSSSVVIPKNAEFANPKINPVRTVIPAFAFTVAAIGITLLRKKPSE